MPCETFSTAGSKSRSSYDHRQQLYYEAIRIANIIKPRVILFENVPGILTKKVVHGGERLIVEDIIDDLTKSGYKYFIDIILDAADFGVPQNRKRFFILATRDKNLNLSCPTSIHDDEDICIKDAFLDLPKLLANQGESHKGYLRKSNAYVELMRNNSFWKSGDSKQNELTYHVAPNHRDRTIQRFQLIKQGENLKDAFLKHSDSEIFQLQADGILPKKWFIQRNMRLVPNKKSKTVTSHCLDELIHPILDRALTVREVARLQSFPDSYDFAGGPFICPHVYETQDKYEQIGDAVPPLLAYAWGKKIREILGAD